MNLLTFSLRVKCEKQKLDVSLSIDLNLRKTKYVRGFLMIIVRVVVNCPHLFARNKKLVDIIEKSKENN